VRVTDGGREGRRDNNLFAAESAYVSNVAIATGMNIMTTTVGCIGCTYG